MADVQSTAKSLSKEAMDVIVAYQDVPYFNNARSSVRFGLRALVGKGSPQEIADEALLYSLREKVNLKNLSPEQKKKFLVDHNIGIDCSGFAYYVLDAESQARGLGTLFHNLSYPFANSLFSHLGRMLRRRYVESADVSTFAHPSNSHEVKPRDVLPGDFFVRINKDRNHMMVVTEISGGQITIAHAEARPEDGRYGHGVRTETLLFSQLALPIHRLNWF